MVSKCQTLFARKTKKNISVYCLLRMLSINMSSVAISMTVEVHRFFTQNGYQETPPT